MLHIILGILKVIGMILGIILLVLLALALAVVFVPLRYQLKVEKQPQEGPEGQIKDERVGAEARISWLLHIFSIRVSINIKRELDIAVRLFGVRLPFFRKGQEERSDKDGEGTEYLSDDSVPGDEKLSDADLCIGTERSADDEAGGGAEAGSSVSVGTDARANSSVSTSTVVGGDAESGVTEVSEESELSKEKDISYVGENTGKDTWDDQDKTDIPGAEPASETEKITIFRKIRFILLKIYDRIKNIIRKAAAFLTSLTEIPEKLSGLWERAERVLRKPQELLELAQKLEAQALLEDAVEYLKYLLLHYKPRRIRGHLKLGTGDPAMSAQLTGLIYLLLPARADKFVIDTEFNEPVFEIEMTCSGHIRACHMIRIFWRAFRNKKLRRLIRYLRKRK